MSRQKRCASRRAAALVLVVFLTEIGFSAPPSEKGGKDQLTLTLQLYSSRVSERMGPGATYGLVIRDTRDFGTPLDVTLQNDNPGAATMPGTITIDAHSDRQLFLIDTLQDADAERDLVTITASAANTQASAVLTVLDDDDPSLPPIEFGATRIPLSGFAPPLNDFNGLGMAVGGSEGASWLYDVTGLVNLNDPGLVDLNDPSLPIIWEPGELPDWTIGAGYGLNNSGLLVGSVTRQEGAVRRGFVLDLVTWKIHLLPDDAFGWVDTFAGKVNDRGDILGWFQRPDGSWGMYLFNPVTDDHVEEIPFSLAAPNLRYTNISNPVNDPTRVIFYEFVNEGYLYGYARGDDQVTQLSEQNSGPAGRRLTAQTNDQGDIAAAEIVAIEGSGKGRKNSTQYVDRLYRSFDDKLVSVDPDSFRVEAINNATTSWLVVRDSGGADYSLLHNDEYGLTHLDALISTGGTRVDFGLMNRELLPGGSVLGYTQIATVNESVTQDGEWDLVILSPRELP